jgi:hypothetical protein
MRTLKLYFEAGQLIEVYFKEGAASDERCSIRGKTGGAFRQAGSFQWTSAVRALSLLAVKAVATPQDAMIQGEAASLAVSLDYAISKQPEWLTDLFGCDHAGISYARRLVLRTNPERKRPGPVVLALNSVYLPASSIEVYINRSPASQQDLEDLQDLLSTGKEVAPSIYAPAVEDQRLAS